MSKTLERARRARVAAVSRPSVTAGRTSRCHPPKPVAGNHPSSREKMKISISPSQNIGMDTPRSATSMAPTSIHVDRHSAATTPRPMPSTSVTANAATASSAEDGARYSISPRTDPAVRSDRPRSPLATR
jgi:hypothetical protein